MRQEDGTVSFNSRLREEATKCPQKRGTNVPVSTHASVRRRRLLSLIPAVIHSFNSRLREEATGTISRFPQLSGGFNSRLREEATWGRSFRSSRMTSFNSRLREEATALSCMDEYFAEVSTHASVRRRLPPLRQPRARHKFQLTPP